MDDDYADIYYVDTRNAPSRDHRTQGGQSRPGWNPASPSRTVYVPPSRQPVTYAQPMAYAQPAPVMYQQPYPQQSIAASFFGKLTTGQVVEMVAQLFAALQPLPGAPVATRDTTTDVGNLILLCRTRHNRIYAARRIMRRLLSYSTEDRVICAA